MRGRLVRDCTPRNDKNEDTTTMKIKYIILIFCITIINTSLLKAQDKEKNWSLNGYFSDLQTVMFTHIDSMSVNDNLLHNRLNFNWYPNGNLSVNIEVRNRFMWGDNVRLMPGYADLINSYDGVDFLSENIIDKASFLFNTTVDRAIIDFTSGNLNMTLGRQRINWGRSFVWNPNDLFNSYSFFDFDYEERYGSDALRMQYYTGAASSIELAIKVDSTEKITAAGLTHINIANYDIQILAGLVRENDWVVGTGWEGNIKNFGFRGEMSYFHPMENFDDTSGVFLASLNLGYTFENSLFVQFEALYDQDPIDLSGGFGSQAFLVTPLGSKDLGFSEFSWFAQLGYPFNPLINGNISFMYYPDLNGFFTGPSFGISLADNLDFSVFVQVFSMELNDEKINFYLGFLRFKYSF